MTENFTGTLTLDTEGLQAFLSKGKLTFMKADADDDDTLGTVDVQPSGKISLLALLRSAYAAGLLAAWTAADGFDEDGNLLEVGDELAGV